MKTLSYTLVLSIIYFCACSSTYSLKDGDITPDKLKEKINGGSVTLVLTNGEEYNCDNLLIKEQLVYWIDSHSGATQSVPTNELYKILAKNHGKGALEGLGYGFLGGFALGAIVGIVTTDPDHKTSGFVDLTPRNYSEGALGYGIGFGIPAALIGLPLGAIAGHQDIYIINEQSAGSQKPEYVKIQVESIVEENQDYIIVKKLGSNIKIERSKIKHLDRTGENIYITISQRVYEKIFK